MPKIKIVDGNQEITLSTIEENIRAYMVKGEAGSDGVSPTATVSKVDDTTTITITDKNGTTEADVLDGYNPRVDVSKSNRVTTLTTTDYYGTETVEINDGIDLTGGVPTNGVIGLESDEIIYTCDGTETGDYYLTYNSIDYYFTMPSVEDGDILAFNTTDLELSLDGTTIITSSTGTGTELTFDVYVPNGYEEIDPGDMFASKSDLDDVKSDLESVEEKTTVQYVTTTGTNLNDYTTQGVYFFDESYTPTNIPTGTNGWLQVFSSDNNRVKQVWYRMGVPNATDCETYVRTRGADGTWGNWLSFPNYWNFDYNGITFTITIPHDGNNKIKSVLVFCKDCAYVVTIGNSSQLWFYQIGALGSVTMTPTISEHTAQYVRVSLTFSETIYGGIKVIV